MEEKKSRYTKRFTISNLNEEWKEQLKNLSDNTGINAGDLLKPKVKELLDSYPEEMKKPKPKF